jgi:hypothetical protein
MAGGANDNAARTLMTIFELDQHARKIARRQIGEGKTSVKLLAKKARTKPSHISNVLAGRRQMSVEMLSAFLGALGLQAELLPASTPQTQTTINKPDR